MTVVPASDDIPKISDPRERLLLAGARLLLDDPFSVVSAGLSPERVTTIAGRSRRVFYDHFETKADFLREVLKGPLADALPDVAHGAARDAAIAIVHEHQGDFIMSTDLISELTLGETFRGDTSILSVLALAIGLRDEDVAQSVAAHYEMLDNGIGSLIAAVLDSWGLELRQPWDLSRVSVVIRALSDGLYMRSQLDQEVDTSTFALAILSMVPTVTRPAGADAESVQSHLARFSEELSTAWREQAEPGEITNARQRTIEALVDAITDRGPRDLTLESVALRAGVSQTTIVRAFGGLEGLLRAAVLESIPSLATEAAFDLQSESLELRDVIGRHLARIGAWITDNWALTQGMLASARPSAFTERGGVARECLDRLSDPLITILQAGVSRGEFHAELALQQVAYMTSESLLGRGASLEGFSLDSTVDFLADLVQRAMTAPQPAH